MNLEAEPSFRVASVKKARRVKQNQFHVFIHNLKMHVQMEKSKGPVNNKTLERNGANLEELKAAYLNIMTTIGLKEDSSIKVK